MQDSGAAKGGCQQIDAVASFVSLQQSVKVLEEDNRRLKSRLEVRHVYVLCLYNCIIYLCR